MICKKEIITKYIHIWIFKKYQKTMVKHSPFNNDITLITKLSLGVQQF